MMPTAAKESEIAEGAWVDPAAGRVAVTEYVEAWVTDHPRLRVRSRENYGAYLRNQIAPGLGSVTLSDLSPAGVRPGCASWPTPGQRKPVAPAHTGCFVLR
jgi:hypothetical protein